MPTPTKCLSTYHPYNKGQNVRFDQSSKMILDFKEGKDVAVHYWLAKLSPTLSTFKTPFYIATVPSSTKGKSHPGFSKLYVKLKNKYSLLNEKGNLIERTQTIPKLATGGNRSKAIQMQTMKALPSKVKGANVVLIDDVTTTGNSLSAAIEILSKAQYNVILVIALGKTQNVI